MRTEQLPDRHRAIVGMRAGAAMSSWKGSTRVRDPLTLERLIAALALFLIGLRAPWHMGLTSGYVIALLLLPLTLPSLGSFRWSKLMVGALGACLAYGLLVSTWTTSNHVLSGQARLHAISLAVGIVVSAILVLWARALMPAGAIAILLGLGGLFGVGGGFSGFAQTWKFGYSIPVTLIVLGAATLWRGDATLRPGDAAPRRGDTTALLALGLLGAITLFGDARSLFAAYVVTGGLLIWSRFGRRIARERFTGSGVAVVLIVLFAVYKLADVLIMQGFLGEKARERSIEDAAASGSTLLGGRPELSATFSLMRDHVAGYGLGVLPNTHDVAVGNSALSRLGLQPTQDGFSTYMFGRQQFELHSIFGDLWAVFGVVGLGVAVLIMLLALNVMSSVVGSRPSVLMIFLGCFTAWNVVSSPLWSSEATLILFLGLAMPMRSARLAPDGHPARPPDGSAVPALSARSSPWRVP